MNQLSDESIVEKYLAAHTVTKCPSGDAWGAFDLQYWAAERRYGCGQLTKENFKKKRRQKQAIR
jgi:hypothetical protein